MRKLCEIYIEVLSENWNACQRRRSAWNERCVFCPALFKNSSERNFKGKQAVFLRRQNCNPGVPDPVTGRNAFVPEFSNIFYYCWDATILVASYKEQRQVPITSPRGFISPCLSCYDLYRLGIVPNIGRAKYFGRYRCSA